jgi:hypothetical protein
MKQKPSCHVEINGKDEEVFMSFALLNTLARHVGDPENIPMIELNADLREMILKEMLAVRTPSGKITEERGLDDVEISIEDFEKLLEFASEHITDFTIRALEKAGARSKAVQEKVTALKLTSSGSPS